MKRVKIIANPSSGREEALSVIEQLVEPFASKGTTVILQFTQKAGDAARFAMEDDGEECIISIGGDGTVNEIVNGMYAAERKVPLAVYPAGTVNDFAESMGIPKDPYEFYAMVCYGRRRTIDIGVCGDGAFINVCAIGLFTEIGYSVNAEAKSSIGRLAYYAEGFRAFRGTDLSKQSFKLHVETDDEEFETDALIAMVVNSKSVGGFSKISPEADVEDGKLELIVIERMSISKVLELFTSIGLGKHVDHDHFIYRKVRSVTLRADKPMRVDIDGEKGPFLPQTIEVVPGAIQFITK
ncbi:MAG: diacylglycerol kinase family lipid kinase [Peptoniphilus sp.]|nr:diacylglycerol kinase family protein [Peptoniphilus sp.]MDD7363272.1 diacylglycerol kinase family lipid kinase [Bacillota bacterium]MDY6045365.1 diacylglycerol kinase family lipid kinase [Peptoniphilus sp.]